MKSSTTGFEPMPGWYSPDDKPEENLAGASASASENPHPPQSGQQHRQDETGKQKSKQKHWPPRTCRICLETVLPRFREPAENIPTFLQTGPSVTYESEEGRLISPCKCKGSSKYVHENCLQAWRHADPAYGRRHYWQCPTCGFQYHLARMGWGRVIASTAAQITLTIMIFLAVTFLLGFIADPIISLYLDPYGTLSPFGDRDAYYDEEDIEPNTWIQHFLKGFASLGLISIVKLVFASPLWIRTSGIGSGSARRGRDRLADLSWAVILFGVATFLWALWKGVRAWSRRTLERAGERVMDVHNDDDDDTSEE